MNVMAAVVGGVAGLILGVVADRWLDRRRYRYPDELSLPERSSRWLVAALPIVVALCLGAWWDASPAFAVVCAGYSVVLGVLTVIDIDVHRLPDAITLPLIPITAGVVVALGLTQFGVDALVRAALAGPALGAFYFVQVLIGRGRGMGLGDAKLALSLGALLGLQSYVHVFAATAITYVAALLWGIGLLLRGGGRRTQFAFGPWMALGAVAVWVAPAIVSLTGGR